MKHYLFDFDGTLVDSMPTYVGVMLRILKETNTPYGEDLVQIITPLGFIHTAKYFIRELGMKLPEEEIIARMNRYAIDEYTYNVPAKQNVIKVIQTLKARGDDLNVLTASPHATLDPCLKRLGIFDLFHNVWSCNDFGTSKSDPEIYRMAAARMGADVDKILFSDDNYNADRTAKTAGMKVCGVYDDSSRNDEKKIKEIADYYIHDFSQLLNLEF